MDFRYFFRLRCTWFRLFIKLIILLVKYFGREKNFDGAMRFIGAFMLLSINAPSIYAKLR